MCDDSGLPAEPSSSSPGGVGGAATFSSPFSPLVETAWLPLSRAFHPVSPFMQSVLTFFLEEVLPSALGWWGVQGLRGHWGSSRRGH